MIYRYKILRDKRKTNNKIIRNSIEIKKTYSKEIKE